MIAKQLWKTLPDDQFDSLFETSKTIFKVEVLQDYSEDHGELFDLFKEGKEFKGMLNDVFGDLKLPQIFERVHIVELPLTTYLEFEIEVYKFLESKGVKIYLQEFGSFTEEEKVICSEDFLIFDNKTIVVNEFDGINFVRSRYSKDKGLLNEYKNREKEIRKKMLTMDTFLKSLENR